MMFNFWGLALMTGFVNGFGLYVKTVDGFTVDIYEDEEVDDINEDNVTLTTGYEILLPLCCVVIQWADKSKNR